MAAAAASLATGVVVASAACGQGRRSVTASHNPAPALGTAQPQALNLTPTAARVADGNKVQVDYTLTDSRGSGIAGAKDVAASWTLAQVVTDPATGVPTWRSVITTHVTGTLGETDQPAAETKGTTEDLGSGRYRYTYAAALPQGFDPAATYRAGVFARRPIAGTNPVQNDVANGVVDFVPAGGTPQPFDAVSTQACNQCHGIVQAHGGFRRETRLCATCHTTQLVDPDSADTGDPSQMNPLDFPRLVHRIHRGRDLPTVQDAAATGDAAWKYHVIGFQKSDNVFAAVAPNRDTTPGQPPLVATGVGFPRDLRDCAVCHAPARDAQGNVQYAAQAADAWKTPSVRACQSCHDATGFTGAQASAAHHHPHPGGLTDADPTLATRCAQCHDVPAIHTVPTASPAFDALRVTITGVTAADGSPVSASQPVQVAFRALHGDGSPVTDLSGFQGAAGRLAVTISGPTTEYSSGNIVTQAVGPAASPTGDYTATVSFPAGSTPVGTWAAGIEARHKNTTLSQGGTTVNDFARNPVAYFRIGGGTPEPRRQVVATDHCNACHGVLSAHGGLRHDVEYCVMCHTPDNGDADQRAAATKKSAPIIDQLPERAIHFKALIHAIHTGEDLQVQRPLVVYGFGGSPNLLDETRFPGTRADCTRCHVGRSYTVDALPQDAAPTQHLQVTAAATDADGRVTAPGQTATVQPIAAACLSCHDTPAAHAHAADMTVPAADPSKPGAETCRGCHGEAGDQAVTSVHAPFTH